MTGNGPHPNVLAQRVGAAVVLVAFAALWLYYGFSVIDSGRYWLIGVAASEGKVAGTS